jgi:cell division transport system permease protein
MSWMLKEALLSFRRRPWTHSAWLLALTLCLGCIGWVRAHAEGTDEILRRLDPAGEVWAFLSEGADDQPITNLLARLEALPTVESARLLTTKQVRHRLAGEFRDPAAAREIPTALLPRAIHLTPPSGGQVAPAAITILRAAPGIESVDAGARELLRTRARVRQIHLGAHLLSLLLTLTIVILGVALGRLVMSLRREEIAVLRLLGATRDRLAGPLLFTGVVVGMVAGFGGYLMSTGLSSWMAASTDLVVATPLSLALRLMALGALTQLAGTGLGMLSEIQRPELEQ